jgi:nucleotide-binding universal stress UspA family protein
MAYTHILAATDFSALANHAVHAAFDEATRHNARVTLLHVLYHKPDTRVFFLGGDPEARAGLRDALIAFPAGYDEYTGTSLPMPSAPLPTSVRRDYDEEALDQLRDLVPATFTGPWNAAVASGDPAQAIVQVAQVHDVDLIVMGSHGHTGLHRLVLGSVSEKVVRHASCAVLTIKDQP